MDRAVTNSTWIWPDGCDSGIQRWGDGPLRGRGRACSAGSMSHNAGVNIGGRQVEELSVVVDLVQIAINDADVTGCRLRLALRIGGDSLGGDAIAEGVAEGDVSGRRGGSTCDGDAPSNGKDGDQCQECEDGRT